MNLAAVSFELSDGELDGPNYILVYFDQPYMICFEFESSLRCPSNITAVGLLQVEGACVVRYDIRDDILELLWRETKQDLLDYWEASIAYFQELRRHAIRVDYVPVDSDQVKATVLRTRQGITNLRRWP